MPVRRPACRRSARLHDREPMSVGQCELLLAVLFDNAARPDQSIGVESLDREPGQYLDKRQKPYRPFLVVTPEEPSVPFRNHQRRGHERRRLRKKPAVQRVVTIGFIEERNEPRSIHIALSLSCHKRQRQSTGWNGDRRTRRNPHSASTGRRRWEEAFPAAPGAQIPLPRYPKPELPS